MLSLSQRQSLLQRLSPQQVQYLKMLQLPVFALEQRIKEEIEQNPLLEEATELEYDLDQTPIVAERTDRSDEREDQAPESETASRNDDQAATSERDTEIDWDEYASGDYDGYKAPSFTGQDSGEQDEFPQRSEESLSQLLVAQLRMLDLTEDEIALAEEIIGNIDDHGYLLRSLDEIVDDLNQFIAATRVAHPGSAADMHVFGDGHFDAYEEIVVDEPFGRDRLLAPPLEAESFAEPADAGTDITAVPGADSSGSAALSEHDVPGIEVPNDDGFADRNGAGDRNGAAANGVPMSAPPAAQSVPGTRSNIATMSLAEMSRLSMDELSLLLEQGSSAFAEPATAEPTAADAPMPAVGPMQQEEHDAEGDGSTPAAVPAVEQVFSVAEAERVLHLIQRLDPPGIGARDLRECLMVQIELEMAQMEPATERFESYELAYRVLRDAYTEFTMKHFEKIGHRLDASTDELRNAMDVIRTLNPKPGAGSSSLVETNYVTPDFVIERDADDFVILSNDRSLPALRINRAYQELIRRGEGRRKDVDRNTKKFIREKFEAAKWFIASIHQRRQTMLKVMRAIVDLQIDFFVGGQNHLRPMIYKDVAERIDMDISTVCRVVNGKYAQTDFGTYELRYFFSEKLETVDGDEVSTTVVKVRIQELIDAEDKHHPLSDDAIAQEMERAGFHVARRTVAKYREGMNIPVARLRRAL